MLQAGQRGGAARHSSSSPCKARESPSAPAGPQALPAGSLHITCQAPRLPQGPSEPSRRTHSTNCPWPEPAPLLPHHPQGCSVPTSTRPRGPALAPRVTAASPVWLHRPSCGLGHRLLLHSPLKGTVSTGEVSRLVAADGPGRRFSWAGSAWHPQLRSGGTDPRLAASLLTDSLGQQGWWGGRVNSLIAKSMS